MIEFKNILKEKLEGEIPLSQPRKGKALVKNYEQKEFKDALQIVLQNCKTYCNDVIKETPITAVITRKIDGMQMPFSVVDPMLHKRQSKDTLNYYTLLMDVLPEWSQFPKRSNCLIGIANTQYYYRVIPFDGAKFGVAATSDLWESFKVLTHSDISAFSKGVKELYEVVWQTDFNRKLTLTELSGKKLSVQLAELDSEKVNEFMEKHTKPSEFDSERLEYKNIVQNYMPNNVEYVLKLFKTTQAKNLLELFRYVMNPETNGIRLFEYKDMANNIDAIYGREVWTSSKCLLVRGEYVHDLNEAIKKAYGVSNITTLRKLGLVESYNKGLVGHYRMRFIQDANLRMVQGYDETTNEAITDKEMFIAGTAIEVDVIKDHGKTFDLKFRDGSVSKNIPKRLFNEVRPIQKKSNIDV